MADNQKPEETTCMICTDAKTIADMFTNSECSHSICTDCISKHIAAKIQDNIANVTCPEPNCEAVLEPNMCDYFVPKEVLDRWGDVLCEAAILGIQRLFCPFVDCSVTLINDGDEVVTEAECPSCKRKLCAQCKVEWHAEIECEEFQKIRDEEEERAKHKSSTETLEGESSNSEATCMICTDTKTAADMFTNSTCSHSFCTDCISQHIAAKIQDNIANVKCPEPNCETVLDPNTCNSFVPKEVLDRWGDVLCEAAILGIQRLFCPFVDCSVTLLNEEEEVVTETECPKCKRKLCAQCKVEWHEGMECEEYKKEGGKEDLEAMKFAKEKDWKRCPNCKIFVERLEGCVHIQCRCGSRFCYSCGAMWGGDHACPESADARRYH